MPAGGLERAIAADEVAVGVFTPIERDEGRVIVTRLEDGTVVAFAAACPHQGHPLTLGTLEAGRVVCPHHFYAYDPVSGVNTFPGDARDLALTVYEVEERGGWIWIGPAAPPAPTSRR